jgi:hypothetical protein
VLQILGLKSDPKHKPYKNALKTLEVLFVHNINTTCTRIVVQMLIKTPRLGQQVTEPDLVRARHDPLVLAVGGWSQPSRFADAVEEARSKVDRD